MKRQSIVKEENNVMQHLCHKAGWYSSRDRHFGHGPNPSSKEAEGKAACWRKESPINALLTMEDPE